MKNAQAVHASNAKFMRCSQSQMVYANTPWAIIWCCTRRLMEIFTCFRSSTIASSHLILKLTGVRIDAFAGIAFEARLIGQTAL
jgi:hypothetical protein